MRSLFALVQLFTFADWIIAAFISGTAARIQGRKVKLVDGEVVMVPDGRRTPLAVGLGVFFAAFALIRIGGFVNLVNHAESLRAIWDQVPRNFRVGELVIAAAKTASLLFCWFAVTIEVRERKGITSGNVIRNWLARWFDRLR